ncbi:MAG: FAD-dependent oxidoreductase [Gordonibacter sp.]|uniref:FAD-dependent oxidoreductase n=1 Tax=Gordonibacter sp. TaxID=1968902 RepID=UPI002FC93C77
MERTVSRRGFLTGAALAAAGVAAGGLAGCASGAPTSGGSGGSSASTSSDIPGTWDEETEVIVVGGGVGMAAAIEAADAGAKVVVLEKGDHAGGLWMTAGGSCTMGGNNVVQQRDGVKDDNDAWFAAEMNSCEYRGNAEVMRALVDAGADTVKWMEDLGIIWGPISAGVLGGEVKRGLAPEPNPGVYEGGKGTPNSGICWTQVWEKKLSEQGVPIKLGHRMTRLYREADGPVVGVEVETPDGVKNLKATKGVVLCTGTWTDNARMAAGWDPRIVGPDTYGDGGVPADDLLYVDSSGDGHIAAAQIGAAFADMSFVSYLYLFFGARSYWGWGEDPVDWSTNKNYAAGKGLTRKADLYQKSILINGKGERYVNEASASDPRPAGRGALSENPEMPFMAAYLSLDQPRNVWMVADSVAAAEMKWPLDEMGKPNPKTGSMFDPACLAKADTLDDLAKQMGIDAATLKATVEQYNADADAGVDSVFGKPGPLNKIATPPFYGAKASLIRHTQRNGVRVNTKSQVLDGWSAIENPLEPVASIDDEPVIPHLYAAGELGNALGWRRVHNSLGHYATAARWAGANAAKATAV